MVASSTTTTDEAAPSSDRVSDQQQNSEETSNKRNQNSNTCTTPYSSSSTPSTTSSGKATTASGSHGSTHTMGKFKEKRPEPLNLNPSLNQEIPLDLSVKSAGNMPSGHLVNTLETPRIFWLDNEALLIKSRLYSSSTNASQKVKLSSLVGDSPPITPNTPSMDLISPTARSLDQPPHSASILLDSNSPIHSFLSAQYQYNKQQQQLRHNLDESLLMTANKLTPTNRFLVHHFRSGHETIKTPRRCCSTDNLSGLGSNGSLQSSKALQSYRSRQQRGNQKLLLQQNSGDGKKNSISPLATRNLSSSNKFSYTENCTRPTMGSNDDSSETRSSPVINVTGDQSQSSDTKMIGESEKALTPTSVASATSNLLNIHLNSPTNQSPTFMDGLTQLGSLSSMKDLLINNKSPTAEYRTMDQSMDPLISAAYCQQHQQNQILRSSLTSSSSFGADNQHDKLQAQQHNLTPVFQSNQTGILTNGFTSLGSSTTLNTPTLISPSQLKSGASIWPSPTSLSPMSSVFELPSPLLMYQSIPSSGSNMHISEQVSKNSKVNSPKDKVTREILSPPKEERHSIEEGKLTENNQNSPGQKLDKTDNTTSIFGNNEPNLSLLVTAAKDKLNTKVIDEEEVSMNEIKMDIDSQDMIYEPTSPVATGHKFAPKVGRDTVIHSQQNHARPATVIPRILVSNVRPKQEEQQPMQVPYQDIQQRENQKPLYQNNGSNHQQQNAPSVVINQNFQSRAQRDMVAKRALSPQSFRDRVSVYHNERIESSSAPPDVYHSRARSKIKSAAETSFVQGSDNGQAQLHRSDRYAEPHVHQLQSSFSQINYSNQHFKTNAPYPDLQPRWPPLPVDEQHSLSIKTGYLTSGRQFSGLGPGSVEQYHHQYHQSLAGGFSQSEQHLRSDWADVKPCLAAGPMVQHQYQSASVGELNRFQMNCGPFVGLTPGQQMANNVAIQQQQTAPATHPLTSTHNNNHLQSPMVKLDDMIHQSPIPIQIQPDFSPNQLSRHGREAQFQGCETLLAISHQQPHLQPQQQPRALSADARGLSRSESSCSSVDFCFRSSSAASGTTAKKYQCDQCAKAFTRSDMLTRHKRLHSKERPFQCNECKQEFSRSDHLSTHTRTHTGEKPYKCKLCSYSACRKDMITRHMKVHNRSSPNAPAME